jgi:RND family efflux transporter MFP subunit
LKKNSFAPHQKTICSLSAPAFALVASALLGGSLIGCARQAPPAAPAMHAFPVQTVTVSASPVPLSDEYSSTIKSRRSATLNPQIDGNLTAILVKSGDHVKAGQGIMEIDPTKQQATLDSQIATERQKLAVYHYNEIEVERQRKLFAAGIISRDALDQAEQAYSNSKADYQSSVALRQSQERQLGYYHIRAPFDGVVGDIPVHLGDYVSATTMLTTVDENKDFEAYIYVPAERAAEVRQGLGVDIYDNGGSLIEHTTVDFISPQVDNGVQGVLAKANLHQSPDRVRNGQLVKARVIWSVAPMPVVPVLAIVRLGGQSFVYVAEPQNGGYTAKQRAVTLGDTVNNNFSVSNGLKNGDKVIVSGIQFLVDGAPVQPLG